MVNFWIIIYNHFIIINIYKCVYLEEEINE